MVGVIVNFDYGGDLDRKRVLEVAEKARSSFEGMPELRLKIFTVDEDHKRAMNVYIWESETAAKAFFTRSFCSARAKRCDHWSRASSRLEIWNAPKLG